MQNIKRGTLGLALIGIGYLLGLSQSSPSQTANAQVEGISEQTQQSVKTAYQATNNAMVALEGEKAYVPAVKGVNAFATSVGGLDAIADLEGGRGVDPETFAALYSGRALDHVNQHISSDSEGRLMYKKKVIRMYSISQMKKLFERREAIAGLE